MAHFSAQVDRPIGGNSGVRLGPLKVSSRNSRYFSDPSGRVVYLTGAHTWNNLIDMDSQYPPHPFNFDAYLTFLKAHNHNLIRLWAWEVPQPDDGRDTPLRKFAAGQPWRRTGPGTDITGLQKFDLTKFEPSYFKRLRSRVEAARGYGMYVIIMLFEGWSVQFSPGKLSHPFYVTNNVNSTGYLRDLRDIHTLRYPEITQLQQRYVQAVLDTVNDLDNVLFEIANEAGAYSTDWQRAMLQFVKCYESTKPIQHPVGLTYQYGGTNAVLFNSDADWIAPGGESGNYLLRPEVARGQKVIISDSDHLVGSFLGDPAWVYKSFFQGLNTLYMDRYVGRDALNKEQVHSASEIRSAMGQVRLISDLVDIGTMIPAPDRSTTGYALQGSDSMLVFVQGGITFTVNLSDMPGPMRSEWFDTVTDQISDGGSVNPSTSTFLQAPSSHAQILHLRNISSNGPPFTAIEGRAESIRKASLEYMPFSIRVELVAKPYLNKVTDGYRALVLSLFICIFSGMIVGFAAGHIFGSRSAHGCSSKAGSENQHA